MAPWEQNLHPQACTCQECVVCPSCNDKFETKRGLIIHFSRLHRDQINEPPTYPTSQNNQSVVKVKGRKVFCYTYQCTKLFHYRMLENGLDYTMLQIIMYDFSNVGNN